MGRILENFGHKFSLLHTSYAVGNNANRATLLKYERSVKYTDTKLIFNEVLIQQIGLIETIPFSEQHYCIQIVTPPHMS